MYKALISIQKTYSLKQQFLIAKYNCSILVGQSIGANQHKDAYKYGMLTTGIGILNMSVAGILLFFLSPWMATWFTNDQTAIDMIVTAHRIDAFAQPALAIGLILAGALQWMGDTKSPKYNTAIGMWVIRIVGVYILGIQLELGIAGVWVSIAIDLFVHAIFLFIKFKSPFKNLKVVILIDFKWGESLH